MTQPTPHFIRGIAANLTYWQEQMRRLTDADARVFLQDQANLLLAVEMGLALPETQPSTAILLLQLFPLIERCGYWERWLPLWETAVAIHPNHEPAQRSRLLTRLGQLRRLNGQLDLALRLHQEAETAAHQSGDPWSLAEAWGNLTLDYHARRAYDNAETHGKQALALFATLPDSERWQATLWNTLGLVALEVHDFALAETRLQHSLTLWQQLQQPTQLARVLKNLGVMWQQQQNFILAGRYYQEAQQHLAATDSELDKIQVQMNLGVLHFLQQQYPQAELAFRLADSFLPRYQGNYSLRAMIAQNLGNVLVKQQRPAEAQVCLQQARILWQQLQDDLNLANTLGTLGEVLGMLGNVATAVVAYDEALTLLACYPAHPWAKKLQREFTQEREVLLA
jgi:tetratricopeptide (TPR) repeat protein